MELSQALTVRCAMSTAKKPERNLGWAIRHVRKEQKRTLQYVALEVGSDPGNISRIERGEQDAPESLLKAIAAVLGLSMADLWQLAERGNLEAVRIAAKAGKLPDAKRQELERYADFLLIRDTKN